VRYARVAWPRRAGLRRGARAAQALEPDTPPSDSLSGGTKVERVLLYAGFDIWRFGRTGYGGFYWAPGGLNNDGFVARLFVSRGLSAMMPTQSVSTPTSFASHRSRAGG